MTFPRSARLAALCLAGSAGLFAACHQTSSPGAVALGQGPAPTRVAPAHDAGVPNRSPLEPVPGASLCVEAGKIVGAEGAPLRVDVGGMRAVVAGDRSRAARLAFTYRGPSASSEPLASGELRRQIGLKLRAQDTCNIVYVMWHVEPSPGIFVSVKRNPGQATHQECADRGYTPLAPTTAVPVPPLTVGTPHTLSAELRDRVLEVTADGLLAWRGELPAESFSFDGPAGVRSDNGIFDFELLLPEGRRARRCPRR